MTYISIIIIQEDYDNKHMIKTIKSIESQTFTDYEIITLNTSSSKYFHSSIDNKIIFTTTNNLPENIEKSNGEYILFLNEIYSLYSENTLQTFTKILKHHNPELLHPKIENTQNNTLPLKNLFYNTFIKKEFIKNVTSNLSYDTPFLRLYIGTNIITNITNYKITDEPLTKEPPENIPISFKNTQEIHEYIKCIKHVLSTLKSSFGNDKILYDFSKNLPEINYDELPHITKNELQSIKNELEEMTSVISNKVNKTICYYISKYFRTFYDMLYNANTDFDVLVSVIIPTYNVEEYIDDCLTSLLEQSLKNIEIICVDDMSTDSTPNIIKYYQQKDKRVKYYRIDKKKGSGGCRNYALTKTSGKYIQYVDSDDFLDLNALKELYELAEREKTQILMFKSTSYIHNENKFIIEPYYDMKEISQFQDQLFGIKKFNENIFSTAVIPWNKLYLRSFLTSLNVKFPEKLIHQDNPFFFEVMINADRIMFIGKYYYNRRHRLGSITKLKNHIELGTIEIIEHILNIFFKYGLYDKYKIPVLNRLLFKLSVRYSYIDKEYREEFYKKCKNKLEKFTYHYNLKDDLNTYLYPENKELYENYMTSKTYEEFELKYNKSK